jgi:hypothetical protein
MKTFTDKYLPWILLALLSCVMVILALASEGFTGGADNINHYFLARYAFQHPLFFFDPWGRPLYTILSSPFAQLGFTGAKLLNVFFGMCTAWFAFRIAKKLDLRPPYLVMIFVVFTPMYCIMLPTTLTEILFGLMLVLTVFFFLRENYIVAAIILSFIPFARYEGVMMLPIFLLAFLLKGKFKPIPFLLTGFVFFSLAGGYFYKDLLWIFHHPPYPVHHEIYKEHGPLLHFARSYNFLFGKPLLLLFLLGSLWLALQWRKSKFSFRSDVFFIILVILVPFVGYFAAHSFLYWKALGGSLGLIRVIAAVCPLASLVSLMGYQWFAETFIKQRLQPVIAVVIISVIVIVACFRIYPFPIPLSPEETTVKAATTWVKKAGLSHKKIIFTDLNVPFDMGLDPNNGAVCSQKWFIGHRDPSPDAPDSSVFIWDAHFGPNESQVPLDSLMQNPHYKLINRFAPQEKTKTLGGYEYAVYVFLRLPELDSYDPAYKRSLLEEAEKNNLDLLFIKEMNFEDRRISQDSLNYSGDKVVSGSSSYLVPGNMEFSPGFTLNGSSFPLKKGGIRAEISVMVFPEVSFTENNAYLVVSIENSTKAYFYSSFQLDEKAPETGRWNKVSVTVSLPEIQSAGDRLKIYIWHKGKQPFRMDDLRAGFLVRK